MIETERLILRPWKEEDAEELYKYAKDLEVGNPAGWPPHTSLENSREIIKTVFSAEDIFAVVLKETGKPIGCCGIVPSMHGEDDRIKPEDAELGYWLGKPYWGRGIIPEAVLALMDYARNIRCKKNLWIAFFDGNEKSKRVAEKCGFVYSHTVKTSKTTEHFYRNSF